MTPEIKKYLHEVVYFTFRGETPLKNTSVHLTLNKIVELLKKEGMKDPLYTKPET